MKVVKLDRCKCCPRNCLVNRNNNEIGVCRASDKIKISKYYLHMWEEPCISSKNGSGTVFFSGCNLKCVYCQNYKISQEENGKNVTVDELSEIFLELQNNGANNINLVSPTIYVYQIKEAILLAKSKGLRLPIIYNTSGYENVEVIKDLEGIIDVYLPDFKYFSNALAKKYSSISNYVENAKASILEMKKQVGNPTFDERGIIKKGLIIRHLILPNNVLNSKLVLKWISQNLGIDTWISVMAQYFPTYKTKNISELNRKITIEELNSIKEYIDEIKLENGYIQELSDHEEEYVPDFES